MLIGGIFLCSRFRIKRCGCELAAARNRKRSRSADFCDNRIA